MKYWFEKNYKTLIIAAFLVPIITVAIVSISHVTKWYGLSNPVSWAAYLSVGIEIAALSALAAISANMGKKVYFPFAIVTIVQFIGNIYFAYSYIDIDTKEFKDWVGLVSPLVEFMGVDPTDFSGHKRFLAFFAGGMLPLISLSFLHMLVKFTEEDKAIEDAKIKPEPSPNDVIDAKDIIGEVSRVRLSDEDLEILQKALLNPQPPNEKLVSAAKKYDELVKNDVIENTPTGNDFTQNTELFNTDDLPSANDFMPEVVLTNNDETISLVPDEEPVLREDTKPEEESQIIPAEEPIVETVLQEEPEQVLIDDEFMPELVVKEDVMQDYVYEHLEKSQLEKLIEQFSSGPGLTPEELERYQNEQDIEELTEDPIWDLNQDSFEDNFDILQQEPVIQKVNIEEVQAPVENIVIDETFNSQNNTNDIWKQYNVEQLDDQEDEDLKKKI